MNLVKTLNFCIITYQKKKIFHLGDTCNEIIKKYRNTCIRIFCEEATFAWEKYLTMKDSETLKESEKWNVLNIRQLEKFWVLFLICWVRRKEKKAEER